MNERSKRYYRHKFIDWRKKVGKHLPALVVAFYEMNAKTHFDYDEHVNLGRVIADINNPAYSIVTEYGKPIPYEERIAYEVMLELCVSQLFMAVYGKTKTI